MKLEAERKKAEKEEKLQKIKKDEEEYLNSKHIAQLQHKADIDEDYNYIVDQLEDEHQRRTVHTFT